MFSMQFWINLMYINVFHGLLLPMKMTIPRYFQRENFPKTFWQRKRLPEPRRTGWSLKSFSTPHDSTGHPDFRPIVQLSGSSLMLREIDTSLGNSTPIQPPTIRLVSPFKKELKQ